MESMIPMLLNDSSMLSNIKKIKRQFLVFGILFFLCSCKNQKSIPNTIEVQTATDKYFLNEESAKVYQDKSKYSIELANSLSNDDSSSWHYYVQKAGYTTSVLLYFKTGKLKKVEEYYEIADKKQRSDVYSQLINTFEILKKEKKEKIDFNVAYQKDSTILATIESLF